MGYTTLSLFAAICFVSAAYGIECSVGPGHKFLPITCPGVSSPTKSYCCEIKGSFRCCDEKEFARQGGNKDNATSPVSRNKRSWDSRSTYETTATTAVGLGTAAIIGIIITSLFPFVICCLCCCCACCPCYHFCHPNNATNVTIIQPPAGGPASSVQNNFSVNVPTQPAYMQQPCAAPAPVQQHPPQYTQEDYTDKREAGWVQ